MDIVTAHGHSADDLYNDLWWKLTRSSKEQDSRNGRVWSVPYPVLATLYNPLQRVLMNPTRDCNPFFHIAEVVWMFAGSDDVAFPAQFNKRYTEYADPDNRVWGAYGHRWLKHFGIDQIELVINRLLANADDRQVVMGMWNPRDDLPRHPHNDRPCNTQIMFRFVDGKLNMLVTNRSNDMIWGMMGANVVHFTYLHELVARSCKMELGKYQVITNNLHVYPDMPRFEEIMHDGLHWSVTGEYDVYPILHPGERWHDLYSDCATITYGKYTPMSYSTRWVQNVAVPMMAAYLEGPKNHSARVRWAETVQDEGWRIAALDWLERRRNK